MDVQQEILHLLNYNFYDFNIQIFITITYSEQADSKYLLQQIYNKTNGPTWIVQPNWFQSGIELCDFTGVRCNDNIIEELDFTSFGLQGELPDEIGQFDYIKSILLSKNSIPKFPQQVCNYNQSLMYLHLSSSNINDSLPECLCNMRALKYLFIDNNELYGQIPTCISSLPAIQLFVANCNQFNGTMGGTTVGDKLRNYFVFCNQIEDCDQMVQLYSSYNVNALCDNNSCELCDDNCPSELNLPVCGHYVLAPRLSKNDQQQ